MPATTYVVTGATSGLGRALVLALGTTDARLLLLGRNEREGERIARRVRQIPGGACAEFVPVDLASLAAVRTAAGHLLQACPAIDALVLCAGARHDRYHESVDGNELTFAANHLGHFLLTHLLLERLRAAPHGRILVVSSETHRRARLDAGWEPGAAAYDRHGAYARSKLANVLFAYELAERLSDTMVTANAIDPGPMASRFARNNGLLRWLWHLGYHGLRGQLRSPAAAARRTMMLFADPRPAGVTGKYFRDAVAVPSSPISYDATVRRALWALSCDRTGLAAAGSPPTGTPPP